MKKLIFTLLITSTIFAKNQREVLEEVARDMDQAYNVQIMAISLSAMVSIYGIGEAKDGNFSPVPFYISSGLGFVGLILPPLMLKKAAIKLKTLNAINVEVNF